eukprot:NODE_99_length_20465_cov_0.827654.p21 type:complete len:114 gc:universal NODE_99_length_20465_cov_0.827654:8845-8504(-)
MMRARPNCYWGRKWTHIFLTKLRVTSFFDLIARPHNPRHVTIWLCKWTIVYSSARNNTTISSTTCTWPAMTGVTINHINFTPTFASIARSSRSTKFVNSIDQSTNTIIRTQSI